MTYAEYGGPERLRLGEQPDPKVGPGEVLVRVRAAGVNPVDWKVMSGGLDAMMETVFPVVPGWDVAGVVEKVGIDAPEFAVGDEVIGYARKDFVHGGTFAELVTVPVRALSAKPEGLSWTEAGGLPLAGLTAYQAMLRLGVGPDDTVLIHNAAGGVGSFATQIAHDLGATVLGTASAAKHDYLRGLGADQALEYGESLPARVRLAAPQGVTVVLDLVGGVLDQTLQVLAPGGRHASIADSLVNQHGGTWMWVRPDGAELSRLAGLADTGRVRVPVAEEFPLEQLPQAFRRSQDGHVRGKLVVTVGAD